MPRAIGAFVPDSGACQETIYELDRRTRIPFEAIMG